MVLCFSDDPCYKSTVIDAVEQSEDCALKSLKHASITDLIKKDHRGATVLHLAAEKRMYRFMKMYEKMGVPAFRDSEGNTPMHYMARQSNYYYTE